MKVDGKKINKKKDLSAFWLNAIFCSVAAFLAFFSFILNEKGLLIIDFLSILNLLALFLLLFYSDREFFWLSFPFLFV